MRRRYIGLVSVWMLGLSVGCAKEPPSPGRVPLTRLHTDRDYLRDDHGRYVFVNGVNVSGSSKLPASIDANGIPTYVGKPFPLADAERNFGLLRDLGFNAIRLVVIWEGLEPRARGAYDTEYIAYLRELVNIANRFDIYVLVDMHQDIFSRHLLVKYNNAPNYGTPGSIANTLLALIPDPDTHEYNDTVQGDGAPRWVIEACLPEKNLDSPNWGTPRVLSNLGGAELLKIYDLYKKLSGIEDTGGDTEPWVAEFLAGLPNQFAINETTDMLPFTFWGFTHALSLDVARSYACLFAGDKVFPSLTKDGLDIKEYLQQAYTRAWVELASALYDQPNVLGYDLINEPSGNYLVLTAVAGLIRAGVPDGARQTLTSLLGAKTGGQVYDVLLALRVLPPDAQPATLALWGLDKLDVMGALDLNIAFDDKYMRPFYERVGNAIARVDPKAVFFIETTISAGSLLGGVGGGLAGQWEQPLVSPEGLINLVYAPHWYPDIYPLFGFNQPPRRFTAEEVRFRDYQPLLEAASKLAAYSLGNVPVVFGEFGTYFNFNGVEWARRDGYRVSAHILDNYYEAFERMLTSRILWDYTPENTYARGDQWNHEDFSILDPEQRPRGQQAWSRPFARALAGKPIAMHFYSPLHYFDPEKGEVNPTGEFEVRYASKETASPTEIVVPLGQYPDGFYVWISDGQCYFDAKRHVLYHLPSRDEPGVEHSVKLLPPLAGRENTGWQYFFRGKDVITH